MQVSDADPAAPTRSPVPRLVAWVLIAPAALLFLISYVWPTIVVAYDGLFTARGRSGWEFVFSARYLDELGYALSFALVPILILATVAPALAWVASRAGTAARWATRAVLALPLAAFAPVGLALVWTTQHLPEDSPERLTPAMADWDGRIALLSTLGLFILAVGVVCYLSALRRHSVTEPAWPAVVTVAVLLAIATLGFAVQQYTFVEMVDNRPINADLKGAPMVVLETVGGAPHMAPVALSLLVILAAMGVVFVLVLRRTGLSLYVDPSPRGLVDVAGRPGRNRLALVATGAGIVLLVVLIIVELGPWLSAVATRDARVPDRFTWSAILVNTWLIPLGTAVVQVVFAALAGFGLAVGRPLGRYSDWLLLVVAPWLLVSNGLLEFARLSPDAETGQQSPLAYAPPSWLSIPALVLFTLLFRGQARCWSRARASGTSHAFLRTMWPALPLTALAVGVVWLTQAQDLVVSTMADSGDGVVANGQRLLARSIILPFASAPAPSLGYPLWILILCTLGALVLQITVLDRVAVQVERSTP